MKKFFILFFSLACMILLLNSCEYQLKEDYYNEINKTDSANIEVSLNDIDSEFNLAGHQSFSYTAFTSNLKLLNVNVFIDNKYYQNYTGINGTFELWSEKYSTGEHQLSIVVTTNSGTGSIADLLQAEGFVYTRSWKFHNKNPVPDPIAITGIFNNNGALKIEWEKSIDKDFSGYDIYKGRGGSFFSYTTITDRNTTSFEDLGYVGGEVSYYIYVHTNNGYATIGPSKTYIDDSIVISARWIRDFQVELSWPKCKYNRAFLSYSIYDHDGDYWPNITDVNTTSITGDFGTFGKSTKYYFSVTPKNFQGFVLYSNAELAVGQPFQNYDNFWKNNINDEILLTNEKTLYRYDVAANLLSKSVEFANYAPYMYYSPADDVLLHNNPLTKRNPVTFDINGTIPGQDNLSLNLSATAWGIAKISGNAVLYDYKNLLAINTLNLSIYNELRISEDNSYIFEREQNTILRCYKIAGNKVLLLWQRSILNYLPIPGSPDKILVLTPNSVVDILQVANNQVLNSFSTTATGIRDVDPVSKIVVLGRYDGIECSIDLYNYETNQKISSIKSISPNAFIKNGKFFIPGRFVSIAKK